MPSGHSRAGAFAVSGLVSLLFSVGFAAGAGRSRDVLRGGGQGQGSAIATKASLARNVVKKANGDVLIPNVPMVDQGAKGYCVASAVERVFRYYGLILDKRQTALLASQSGSGATSISGMMEGLNRIAKESNVRVRAHEKFDFREFEQMLGSYNREASRVASAPEVHFPKAGVIDIAAIYFQVEPVTFRTARMKGRGYKRFHREITKHIEDGVPLLWSVQLGMYPEEKLNPQTKGGHMRLIIGFNEGEHSYFFTDTWGSGHEMKRMSAADAYAMTTGLFTIEPAR
jgi:hypothetical protein